MKQIIVFLLIVMAANLQAQTVNFKKLKGKSGATIVLDGYTINDFSNDVTLSDSSNLELPTEAAVKAYVDKGQIWLTNAAPTGNATYKIAIDTVGTDSMYFNYSWPSAANWVLYAVGSGGGTNYMAPQVVIGTNTSKNKSKADYLGDGSADQVQINSAISTEGSGSHFFLLDGVFNLTGSINVNTDSLHFQGSGIGVTFLDVDLLTAFNISSGVRVITISDMTIYGTKTDTLDETSTTFISTEAHVRAYNGKGTQQLIDVNGLNEQIIIERVAFRDSDGVGVYADNTINGERGSLDIINCDFFNLYMGVEIGQSNAEFVRVMGNKIFRCFIGVGCGSNNPHVTNNRISRCRVGYYHGKDGLSIAGRAYLAINKIIHCRFAYFLLYKLTDGNTIIGNHIAGNNATSKLDSCERVNIAMNHFGDKLEIVGNGTGDIDALVMGNSFWTTGDTIEADAAASYWADNNWAAGGIDDIRGVNNRQNKLTATTDASGIVTVSYSTPNPNVLGVMVTGQSSNIHSAKVSSIDTGNRTIDFIFSNSVGDPLNAASVTFSYSL